MHLLELGFPWLRSSALCPGTLALGHGWQPGLLGACCLSCSPEFSAWTSGVDFPVCVGCPPSGHERKAGRALSFAHCTFALEPLGLRPGRQVGAQCWEEGRGPGCGHGADGRYRRAWCVTGLRDQHCECHQPGVHCWSGGSLPFTVWLSYLLSYDFWT